MKLNFNTLVKICYDKIIRTRQNQHISQLIHFCGKTLLGLLPHLAIGYNWVHLLKTKLPLKYRSWKKGLIFTCTYLKKTRLLIFEDFSGLIASFEAALFITNDYLIPIVRQVEANLLHYSVDVSFVQSTCCFFYQWQSTHRSNYIEIALHKPTASWYLSSRLKNDSINWNLEPYLHKHYWDFLNQLLQFYLSIQIQLICLKSKRIRNFCWQHFFIVNHTLKDFCSLMLFLKNVILSKCESGSWRIRLRD